MQLVPSTAADPNVGIPDIEKLDKNIHAGTKYLRFIVDRYFTDEAMDDTNKMLFAFASYNAGPARVSSLMGRSEKLNTLSFKYSSFLRNVHALIPSDRGFLS